MSTHPSPNKGLSFLSPEDVSPWENYLAQVEQIVPYLGPLTRWVETLRRPKRIAIVDVPIIRDDGSIAHFEGYRVQHNTSRGPAKGGLRYHPDSNLAEGMALSAWMTIKNAVVDLPYGGGKGAARVDPATLSRMELEKLTRRYTAEIAPLIGPDRDIPAPDINTNAQVMAWMMDTYALSQGRLASGVVTGKPVILGGSHGRKDATGEGVFIAARETMKRLDRSLDGIAVIIQGYGNVGSAAARFFASAGARIVAIQEHDGAIMNMGGIDLKVLDIYRASHNTLRGLPGCETIERNDIWDIKADILIPAALENQITADVARRLKVDLVIEGANGPTTQAGGAILKDRGIVVVPDVLANAGGVIVSYFEWVQDFSSYFWPEAEVRQKLDAAMTRAFDAVWECHLTHRVDLRTAAYILACTRVLEARDQRGLYP